MTDYRERQYVSRYATDVLGLSVHVDGVPADVDADVTVRLVNEATTVEVFERTADHPGLGLYETRLTSEESGIVGNFTVEWSYEINAVPEIYRTYIAVGEVSPEYDALDPGMKQIVDDTWIKFSDIFDSPEGGPNLQTYYQSHFSRNRLAQLLRTAVGLLNTTAQPFQTYGLDNFPVAQWGPLLGQALYVEVIKHLTRSYVEQPAFVGGNVTRLDRRDYLDRWQSILVDERKQLKQQLDTFKISNMGLGKPKILVSGGVYGRYGPTKFAGSVAARPRYWSRFY